MPRALTVARMFLYKLVCLPGISHLRLLSAHLCQQPQMATALGLGCESLKKCTAASVLCFWLSLWPFKLCGITGDRGTYSH